MHPSLFLAQAAPSPAPDITTLVLYGVAFVMIFYFLLIRPQRQQEKERAARVASLKIGDRVLLRGGMFGMIANIKEGSLMVKVADNVKIEFDKNAVETVLADKEKSDK